MRSRIRCLLLVTTVATFFASLPACRSNDDRTSVAPTAGPPSGLQVLFVGNSLTYTYDVPARVRAMADADDDVSIATRDLSRPNFALMDHWATGSDEVLRTGAWDVVVLQQGPSSLSASRENLIQWTNTWADLATHLGTRAALAMVWPDASRLFAFDAVSESYRAAADSAGIGLFPTGEAWRAAWTMEPSLALYGPDDFHPSPLGATLAAISIYRGITGRMPSMAAAARLGIDDVTFATLLAAAAEAHAAFGIAP